VNYKELQEQDHSCPVREFGAVLPAEGKDRTEDMSVWSHPYAAIDYTTFY
jgi:hypothetical protein